MNKTTISFNATSEIKSRLQKMADDYGITISDLMRMSATQIVNKGIAIEPTFEPTDHLAHAIKSAEKDLRESKTTTISSPDELSRRLAGLRK